MFAARKMMLAQAVAGGYAPEWATIATISHAGAGASPAINTTGADLIVVVVSQYDGSAPSITDSKGNTWTLVINTGGIAPLGIFYCVHPVAGSGHTFTNIRSASSICVAAFSGSNANPVGASSSAGGNSASPLTPTQNNTLLIAGAVYGGGFWPSAPYVDYGFTVIEAEQGNPGNWVGCVLANLVQETVALVDPTWAGPSGAADWTGIVEFKPATVLPILPGYFTRIRGDSFNLANGTTIPSFTAEGSRAMTTQNSGAGVTLVTNHAAMGGRKVLDFSGTHMLSSTTTTPHNGIGSSTTWYFVLSAPSGSIDRLFDSAGEQPDVLRAIDDGVDFWNFNPYASPALGGTTTPCVITITTSVAPTRDLKVYKDGVLVSNPASANTAALAWAQFGLGGYNGVPGFIGKVADMVIYDSTHTGAEIARNLAFFQDYYGL